MSVPTANVLVTNNRKALDDILLKMSSGGKVYNLVNELTDNDDLALFSNQANPYFISFKHSFSQENPPGLTKIFMPKLVSKACIPKLVPSIAK